MPQVRQNPISLADKPYYHCIKRCVRPAFLRGEDGETGNSYEHRKQRALSRSLSFVGDLKSLYKE